MLEEPEQLLPQQRVAAERDREELAPSFDSMTSIVQATTSGGIAKTIITQAISTAHAMSGMRCSAMPGARRQRIVVMRTTARHSAETWRSSIEPA